MEGVDEIPGYERQILFNPENLYTTSGGGALTNCVVEAVTYDWQSRAPMLSLRFYSTPYLNRKLIEEVAAQGQRITMRKRRSGWRSTLALKWRNH